MTHSYVARVANGQPEDKTSREREQRKRQHEGDCRRRDNDMHEQGVGLVVVRLFEEALDLILE